MNSASMSIADAMVHAQAAPKQKGSKLWRWVGFGASLLLLGIAVYVLTRTVQNLDPNDLRRGFAEASWQQIGLASAFTALSYTLLTFYDVLALRQVKAHFIRYRTAAFASFTSYAISFTLGFPLLTAGAVRFWVYAPRGLSAQKIASLTLIAAVTFWLGMGLVIGISLIFNPLAMSEINKLAVNVNRLIGVAVLAAAIAYVVWVATKRRQIRFQGWKLSLPNWRVTSGQMLLGVADVCAGGAVLFFLLPQGHTHTFEAVLAVYVFGHMLGVASHVPGGVGAFEATILVALSGNGITQGELLSCLLLYRCIYYLAPFALAVAMLGLGEVIRRAKTMRDVEGEDDEDEIKPPSGA
jgi:glycosyltransferase 2 family protein